MFMPIDEFLPVIASAQKTMWEWMNLPLLEEKKVVCSGASQAPTRCSTPDELQSHICALVLDHLISDIVAAESNASCSDASEPQVCDEQARILEQLNAIDLTNDADSDGGAPYVMVNLIEGETYSMTATCPTPKLK